MTHLEEQHCAAVAQALAVPQATIRRLMESGLMDRRKVEQLAIRKRLEAYRREGARICDAMEWTAEEFCCSYQKVRTCYYQKT